MYCVSLAYWENVVITVIVIIAIIALLRLLVMALGGGGAWWPPQSPWAQTTAGGGPLGYVAAAINILIWAVVMIAIVLFIFSLIGCLLGAIGGFHIFPRASLLGVIT